MPASTATHSCGTRLSWDTAGGTTYADIAEVIDLDGPSPKIPAADVSNLQSPNCYREKRPKMVDPGAFKAKMNFTKAQYGQLLGQVRKYPISFKISFPLIGTETTASSATWSGFIGGIGMAIPDDDRITNDVDVEVSGPITFTAGS